MSPEDRFHLAKTQTHCYNNHQQQNKILDLPVHIFHIAHSIHRPNQMIDWATIQAMSLHYRSLQDFLD